MTQKRWWHGAVLFGLCAWVLSFNSPAQSDYGLGVVAQSATYDPVKQEIAIRFYNSTRHDVTAYHYSLRIDYADGTT